jgi:uncharacterized protein YqjF (DUF2071 family)
MRMWWRDLLFIHYPYAPEVVQALLPDDLTIDTWPDADGIQQAWVALVPFEMVVGTPGGLRLPLIGTFPETNVRTYVRGPDGTPGVWFCSLEAGGLLASLTARAAYGLPYFWADMSIDPGRRATDGVWRYDSTRRWPRRRTTDGALPSHRSVVRIGTPIADGDVSDFERFLTSRWGLYSRFPSMDAARAFTVYAPVDHGRWPLFRGELLELDDKLLDAAGLPKPTGDPVVHWTPGTEVRIGRPRRANRAGIRQPSSVP